MISLETAKALKDAGLAWKPKVGDRYLQEYCSGKEPVIGIRATDNEGYYQDTIQTQLPRLDQLLAEIEKQGWTWMLYAPNNDDKYGIEIGAELIYHNNITVMADSPDEAAAQALLWILNEK